MNPFVTPPFSYVTQSLCPKCKQTRAIQQQQAYGHQSHAPVYQQPSYPTTTQYTCDQPAQMPAYQTWTQYYPMNQPSQIPAHQTTTQYTMDQPTQSTAFQTTAPRPMTNAPPCPTTSATQYCWKQELLKRQKHPLKFKWLCWVIGGVIVGLAFAGLIFWINYRINNMPTGMGRQPRSGALTPKQPKKEDNNFSSRNETVRGISERTNLFEVFDKPRQYELIRQKPPENDCGKEYFIGHEVDLARSWITSGGTFVEGPSSFMWAFRTKDGKTSDRCSALSKSDNFRIVNVPCNLRGKPGFCIICETFAKCPAGSMVPCYKTLTEPVRGWEMAQVWCGGPRVRGKLAVPRDEFVWTRIKDAHKANDPNEQCEYVLLNPRFSPRYKSTNTGLPTYTLQNVQLTGTMDDLCVKVSYKTRQYFLASCDNPGCYVTA